TADRNYPRKLPNCSGRRYQRRTVIHMKSRSKSITCFLNRSAFGVTERPRGANTPPSGPPTPLAPHNGVSEAVLTHVRHRCRSRLPARVRASTHGPKGMFETNELMLQLASVSVWLVIVWPWTVKLLKWTPLMLTVA